MEATTSTAKKEDACEYQYLYTVHGNKPLRIGLLKFFLKQADLHESDLG